MPASVIYPFSCFPELETSRLCLRRLQPADAPAILALFSDPELTRYLNVSPFHELAEAAEFIQFLDRRFENELGIRWGIWHKADQQLIGTCGYNVWNRWERTAELGYELERSYRRQGLMREAVQAVLRLGFGRMGLQRVIALVMPQNVPSQQFLRKLGFVVGGTVREFQLAHGCFETLLQFNLSTPPSHI